MEVRPTGSPDINPFDYLKCGVSRRGTVLTDPLTKKSVPDSHRHGGLQQHPKGGRQEKVLMVLAEAGEGHWYQGRFYLIKAGSIPN